jgi:hypothetical protein
MGLMEHALFWGRMLNPKAELRAPLQVAEESVAMFCRAYRPASEP